MTERDFHLHKGWEVQKFGCAAWIDEDPMHIKIFNTQGEYKCIIIGSDDPSRIYRRKGIRPSIG